MMNDVIVSGLLLSGSLLTLIAAIGVLRMPDLFMRISVATKASTLGMAAILLAVALHFGIASVTARALAILAFLFITAPAGAHVMVRAAYMVGVPLWERTVIDELRGRYDFRTHALGSDKRSEDKA